MTDPQPAKPAVTHDEAMAVAEAARESEWQYPSFVAELFMGRFRPDLIFPYPEQPEADKKQGDEFLAKLEKFLRENLDPDEVDRTHDIPVAVIKGLADLGCFAMKIPTSYGGLGLSQVNYNRAVALVASYCGSTAVWLSAHQSIGVPQPLKLFGTDEQKQKYFPLFAKGFISAFALTEPDVGSDPARMSTTATPNSDRTEWTINGDKLWCTNGPVADVIAVMARTPDKTVNGKPRRQITAFIVDRDTPGIEVIHRCEFMGLNGIQNGLMRFTNVKVPSKNILWEEGKGLKLALITLNTGRLTLPAACTGMAKQCLHWVRQWANERVQWGAPIGRHEAIAQKIGWMAATTFAMEAVTYYASALADRGDADIRLEAAMAKMFCSEAAWKIADETVQIRGGRGYETSRSLRARGEKAVPAERAMRDARINMIIEGSSEIMRLFIAREAVDRHMRLAGDIVKPEVPILDKLILAGKAVFFYARWYPALWFHLAWPPRYGFTAGPLASHLRFAHRHTRRLARTIFHAMLRFGPGLEKRQAVLNRIVDIGSDLFAIAATVSHARALVEKYPHDQTPIELADLFCRQARRRVRALDCAIWCHDDARAYKLARRVLEGKMTWLETGAIGDTP